MIVFFVRIQRIVVKEMPYYIIADIHSAVVSVVERMDGISKLFIDPSHAVPYANISSLTYMEWFIRIGIHILYQNLRF